MCLSAELNGDIYALHTHTIHTVYKNIQVHSSCTILKGLTDTSCGPRYHAHHLLKSLRKHFSVDFHSSCTARLFRADRHTAAGAPFTTTMSMCVSVTERCALRPDWQRSRGGVQSVQVCVCVSVRWGVKKNGECVWCDLFAVLCDWACIFSYSVFTDLCVCVCVCISRPYMMMFSVVEEFLWKSDERKYHRDVPALVEGVVTSLG